VNSLMSKLRGNSAVVAALFVLMTAGAAEAQDLPRPQWEAGMDIYSGTGGGEASFYGGAFGGNSSLAFRFSALDEGESVPCSVGVMYEYVGFRRASVRIMPTAGVSANRIFSCASDGDVRRASPSMHGSRLLTAGVRVPIFRGSIAAGSLKVMAFAGRIDGHTDAADAPTRGVVMGVVFHAR
jgi:hypothetical protein